METYLLFHFPILCGVVFYYLHVLHLISSPVDKLSDFQFGALFDHYILYMSFGKHRYSFLLDIYLGMKLLNLSI